ncbi:MAG: hypothetical protein DMF80_07155 [Acidobacteria bacterium]|nr:MAG: hypothetical protein DMF80_07155 [Acidobacteriota bacterium]PYQ23035.1 MAG: hypothetical protein DMF81_10005 [Acidobacteriota bacterium]
MVTVCAWCDRLIGLKEPGERVLVTHGICEACSSRLDWRASPTLVVSRRHATLVPVLAQLLRGHPHINVLVDRRSAERRQVDKLDLALERRERPDRRQASPMILG